MVWLISMLVLLVLVSSLTHELLIGVTYVQVPPETTDHSSPARIDLGLIVTFLLKIDFCNALDHH